MNTENTVEKALELIANSLTKKEVHDVAEWSKTLNLMPNDEEHIMDACLKRIKELE